MISSEELLEKITTEDVVKILIDMGSEQPKTDDHNNLYFTTICHGGNKHKLHFFIDSKFFMCYTNCGSMSLFDVLMHINNWNFVDAFSYLAKYKKINISKQKVGLQKSNNQIDDELIFLDKHLYTSSRPNVNLPSYNKRILDMFDRYYPNTWLQEGITEDILKYYDIRFYFNQFKAIIPHLDISGNLVGIKSRNFLDSEIDSGRKYIPITIQGLTYKYPVQFNLYGLYQNKENIRKSRRVVLFESEKSVFKYGSYYKQENNIAVASSGMTLSLYQRDLLLDLNIEDIVIAYDKQYLIEFIDDEYKETKEYKDYQAYLKKILKIASMFIDYCNVYVILCWNDRLNYKDSPIDGGKELFEQLYKERYLIDDLNDMKEMIL